MNACCCQQISCVWHKFKSSNESSVANEKFNIPKLTYKTKIKNREQCHFKNLQNQDQVYKTKTKIISKYLKTYTS